MAARQEREAFTSLDDVDKRLVRMVCSGLTDEEIANRIQEPEGFVAERVGEILTSIGAASRTQLVISAVSYGL